VGLVCCSYRYLLYCSTKLAEELVVLVVANGAFSFMAVLYSEGKLIQRHTYQKWKRLAVDQLAVVVV
jgi:hypothetical protein